MVVPAAYGDTGLKKVNIGVGKKRYTGLKVCDRPNTHTPFAGLAHLEACHTLTIPSGPGSCPPRARCAGALRHRARRGRVLRPDHARRRLGPLRGDAAATGREGGRSEQAEVDDLQLAE